MSLQPNLWTITELCTTLKGLSVIMCVTLMSRKAEYLYARWRDRYHMNGGYGPLCAPLPPHRHLHIVQDWAACVAPRRSGLCGSSRSHAPGETVSAAASGPREEDRRDQRPLPSVDCDQHRSSRCRPVLPIPSSRWSKLGRTTCQTQRCSRWRAVRGATKEIERGLPPPARPTTVSPAKTE